MVELHALKREATGFEPHMAAVIRDEQWRELPDQVEARRQEAGGGLVVRLDGEGTKTQRIERPERVERVHRRLRAAHRLGNEERVAAARVKLRPVGEILEID